MIECFIFGVLVGIFTLLAFINQHLIVIEEILSHPTTGEDKTDKEAK